MKIRFLAILIAFSTALPSSPAQEEAAEEATEEQAYRVGVTYPLQLGEKLRVIQNQHVSGSLVIRRNGEVVHKEENRNDFRERRYTEEVLEVDEQGRVVRALRHYDVIKDSSFDLDVSNVSVLLVTKEDGHRRFAHRDGSQGDERKDRYFAMLQFEEEGNSSGLTLASIKDLLPREEVRVGDSWEVTPSAAFRFLDVPVEEFKDDMVRECTGLVEALEQVEGIEVLRLKISIDLALDGGMQLAFKEPGNLHLEVSLLLATDGSSPFRQIEAKGHFNGSGMEGDMEMTFAMSMDATESVTLQASEGEEAAEPR